MPDSVLSHPEFGSARILRPFFGFEALYQGSLINRPIYLSEVVDNTGGGSPIDPLAESGEPGYASNLIRGLPVVMGQRVLIWFPKIYAGPNELTFLRYTWDVTWRMRNLHDFRLNREQPYHLPKQGAGVPDSTVAPPATRVPIAACNQSIQYTSALPPDPNTGVVQPTLTESYSFGYPQTELLPFVPGGGTGIVQQGIIDPAVSTTDAGFPFFQWLETAAVGDEMLISIRRVSVGGATYNFNAGGDDFRLSRYLGTGSGQTFRDLGVYVFLGVSP